MPNTTELWSFIEGQPLGIALAILVIVGFLRGWIVPGYIYAATVARLDKMLEGIQTLSIAVDRLTDEVRSNRRAPR